MLRQPAAPGPAGHWLSQGWEFSLALEAIAVLKPPLRNDSDSGAARAVPWPSNCMSIACQILEPALAALTGFALGGGDAGIGPRLLEEGEPRYVLLADPRTTALAPLLEVLLLRQEGSTAPLWGAQWLGAAHSGAGAAQPIGRLARL